MNREELKRLIEDPCSTPGSRPTIQGYRFILLMFLLGLAAVNTGNNLIYLILSMIAAMVAVSVFLLPGSLNNLVLRLQTPHPIHAGAPAWLAVTIYRQVSRPAYDIRVRLRGQSLPGTSTGARIARIEGLTFASCSLSFTPEIRGRLRVGDILLSTGFPFGLIMKTRALPQDHSVLVYPALRPIRSLASTLSGVATGAQRYRFGHEGEYLFDREYQHGDSLRHVHWKASARTGTLLVKEYTVEEAAKVTLCLATGPSASPDLFEKTVSAAASIAAFLSPYGLYLRLVCERSDTGFGVGREHLYRVMDTLALASSRGLSTPAPGPEAGFVIGISSGPVPSAGHGPFDLIIDAEQEL